MNTKDSEVAAVNSDGVTRIFVDKYSGIVARTTVEWVAKFFREKKWELLNSEEEAREFIKKEREHFEL